MLPEVAETMVPPGFSSPDATALRSTYSTMRSLMLPVGLANSHFARICTLPGARLR